MLCPELAYLNCWQALNATDPPRAQHLLHCALQRLQQRASAIPGEALRQSYWNNVPWNRTIAALASSI